MSDLFRLNKRAVGLSLLFVFFSLLMQGHLIAGEVEKKTNAKPDSKADYVLKIEKGLISLIAKDASLKQIVEEIGREMNIEVDAIIPVDQRVTMEFDKLSLDDSLKKLSADYAYVMDSENDKGKITKIILLPKGEGKGQSVMPQTGGADVRVVESQTKPGNAAREQITEVRHEEALKEKEPRPEPFKFEFNP